MRRRPASMMGTMASQTLIPLTGAQYEISAGDYRATVTELGAGLRQLSYRGQPVISEYEPDELPPAGAGQLLAPWPNRVDGGRYSFGGTTRQLDLSEPANGNAIHGLTRWAGWQISENEPGSVLLRHLLHGRPGYPFCLDLGAEYRLSADGGLQVSITARNAGTRRPLRHRISPVPDRGHARHRRVRACAACGPVAAGGLPRDTGRGAGGCQRHAAGLPDGPRDRRDQPRPCVHRPRQGR